MTIGKSVRRILKICLQPALFLLLSLTSCGPAEPPGRMEKAPNAVEAVRAKTRAKPRRAKAKEEPQRRPRPPSIVRSSVTGQAFRVPANRWAGDFSQRLRWHEPKTNKLLIELALLCPDNSIIIDAGAHVGDTGLVIAKHVSLNSPNNVTVYQIDPDASKINFIDQMAAINKVDNIKTLRAGLSDEGGQGKAIMTGHPGAWKVQEVSEGDFSLITVDEVVGSKKICVIHLDVEGMEFEALIGSKKVLRTQKPPVVLEYLHGDRERIIPFLRRLRYVQKWAGEKNILFINNGNAIYNQRNLRRQKILTHTPRKIGAGRPKAGAMSGRGTGRDVRSSANTP